MKPLTTWDLMVKYNLPAPGSKIRVVDHLDTYVTPGRLYTVGWYNERGCPSGISMQSEVGLTHVAPWQFQTCEWEYDYSQVENPHLKWPQAQRTVWYYQDGRDFYMFKTREDVNRDGGLWNTYTSIIKVPDWDIEAAQAAEQNFLTAYCAENNIQAIKVTF